MKEQQYNLYPTFSHGEVLTMDSMNNLVSYLDEQQLITRSKLLGSGIIKGLIWNYIEKTKTICIYPGTALTPDGHIIDIPEMVSVLVRKNSNDQIELVNPNADLKGYSDQFPFNINNYVLALRHSIEDVKVVKCNQLSCDVQMVKKQIVIKPELIAVKDIKVPCYTSLNPIPTGLELKRLNNLAALQNVKYLRPAMLNLYEKNAKTLTDALEYLISKLFGNNINDLSAIYGDWGARINHLKNAISRIKGLSINSHKKAMESLPQYYLDFLEDMKDAYNEFADFFNEFVKKYRFLHYDSFVKKDDRVLLGNQGNYIYTEQFKPAKENPEFASDKIILKKLFNRMCLMSQYFRGQSYSRRKMNFKVIPVVSGSRLEDRVIPFYYQENDDLIDCWVAHSNFVVTPRLYSKYTYSSTKNPGNTIYSPQGYYCKELSEVKAVCADLQDNNGIPVKFEFIRLEKSRLSQGKNLKNEDKTRTHHENYQKLVTELLLGKDSADKMSKFLEKVKKDKADGKNTYSDSEPSRDTFLREMPELISLARRSDLKDLVTNAATHKEIPLDKLRSFQKELAKISNLTVYIYCKNTYTNKEFKLIYGNKYVAAFAQLKSFINFTYKEQYNCSEMGGAERFRTIVFGYVGKRGQEKVVFTFGY